MPRHWLIYDLCAVAVFAAIGRLSHDEGLSVAGWWHTAWPFLVGALLADLLALTLGLSVRTLGAGVLDWLVTWCCGMALRALTDQGTAPPFMVVALVVLGLLLVVPRAVTARTSRVPSGG